MFAFTLPSGRLLTPLALAIVTATLAILPTAPPTRAQGNAGAVDPVFGGASVGLLGQVSAVAAQPGGKVLVAGTFRRSVVRLNPDGTTDETFVAPSDGQPLALAIQPDGKIVIGGGRISLARLNPDGTLDAGFKANANAVVLTVALQPDGKILVGGTFSEVNGVARRNLARLNADGSLDAGFSASASDWVETVALQPDGKILVGGEFRQVSGVARDGLARLNADGTLDEGFNAGAIADSTVLALAVQPDGKILVGGQFFRNKGGDIPFVLSRLLADGSLDASFTSTSGGNSGTVRVVRVQPDGNILLGGGFEKVNGGARNNLARLLADGTLDLTFNANPDRSVSALALQPDGGGIITSGQFTKVGGVARNSVARLGRDGSVDAAFVPDVASGPNATLSSLVLQTDGKVVLGGKFTAVNGSAHSGIARVNSDCSLDPDFAASTDRAITTLALQSDGRIILSGSFSQVNGVTRLGLARLNLDGSLDGTFRPNVFGGVNAVAVQSRGKLLVGGTFGEVNGVTRNAIARLNDDGRLDASFQAGTESFGEVKALAVQTDGKILLGGKFTQVNGVTRGNLARLNADGSLDAGFNVVVGDLNDDIDNVSTLAVQPDGKIVFGGLFVGVNGELPASIFMARLNADGSLDASFKGNPDGRISTLAVQPDGRIVVGGEFTQVNGVKRNHLARLLADGSLDPDFDPGADDDVSSLALQPDGKILIGGEFTAFNGVLRNRIARLTGDANRSTALVSVVGAAPTHGGFLVSRVGGQLGAPLAVAFHVGGAAIGGNDYQTLSGRVAFAAGQSEAVIPVILLPEANRSKKVKVFLDPGPRGAYDVGKAQTKLFLSDL